ncbi:MAG: phage holin family protein [Propionibacteriales bacterium]|nr:phage holin family protein [Propionibacteriales bacterium]
MTKFLTTWILNGLALVAAAALLGTHMSIGDGSEITTERVVSVAAVAAVFTLINMLIAPVVKTLSLPFIILTLGLALLVINALLLLLTEWVTDKIDVSFFIDGFWWAVLASIVISIVNGALGTIFKK